MHMLLFLPVPPATCQGLPLNTRRTHLFWGKVQRQTLTSPRTCALRSAASLLLVTALPSALMPTPTLLNQAHSSTPSLLLHLMNHLMFKGLPMNPVHMAMDGRESKMTL